MDRHVCCDYINDWWSHPWEPIFIIDLNFQITLPYMIILYSFLSFFLCFLKMAYEMHGVLSGAISLTTWEKVMPAYGGEPESFLKNVVTPIYTVIKDVLSNVSSFCFYLAIFFNITNLSSNQRKLKIAKVGQLTILHGETMMIWMNTSGQYNHQTKIFYLFSWPSFHIISSLLLFYTCIGLLIVSQSVGPCVWTMIFSL